MFNPIQRKLQPTGVVIRYTRTQAGKAKERMVLRDSLSSIKLQSGRTFHRHSLFYIHAFLFWILQFSFTDIFCSWPGVRHLIIQKKYPQRKTV